MNKKLRIFWWFLVTELGHLLLDRSQLLSLGSNGLSTEVGSSLLTLIESLSVSLALLLQVGNHILVLPSDLIGDAAQSGELASGLQVNDTQGTGDNHTLGLVVWWGDSLEHLQAAQSCLSTSGLVGDHTAQGTVEDTGGGAEMERSVLGVGASTLAQVAVDLDLVTEERSRYVHLLTADHNHLLSVQQKLGNN